MSRGRHLASVLSVCVAAAWLATSSSATAPVKLTDCDRAATRPRHVLLSCGDGNAFLRSLRWSSFGGSTAKATGTLVVNTCEPDCADGRDHSYAVAVTAASPRTCRGGTRVYDKLSLRFVSEAPADAGDLRRWTLGCPA